MKNDVNETGKHQSRIVHRNDGRGGAEARDGEVPMYRLPHIVGGDVLWQMLLRAGNGTVE